MKLKKWTKNEDLFLIKNSNMPNKELAIILLRTIPSIKNRKKKLNLTEINLWTHSEIDILKTYYSNSEKSNLLGHLPNRTWMSIIAKAKELKIYRLDFYHENQKNNDLSILLQDSFQSYYYIGLLMADGYFNGRGIILSQTNKNSKVIDNFGNYIKCTNIKTIAGKGEMLIENKSTFGNNKRFISANDHKLVPKIMEKFLINYETNVKTKTYYPPNEKIFDSMTDDLFLSYFIGFIDGDGHISKEIRGGNSIVITSHINWFKILEKWKYKLEKIYKIKLSCKSIKIEGNCCRLRIYNRNTILKLKNFIKNNNLEVNENKWGRIKLN